MPIWSACSVPSCSRWAIEDTLLIWKAKCQDFDSMCGLGVQLLCGAGLQPTKAFLAAANSAASQAALAYIEKCEGAGDFDGFTPAEHLAFYRRYFGLEEPGATADRPSY
jgi:hypothetical protein